MCFWMPAAVLSTFPQFFQRHLNITFMEFWKGAGGDIKADTGRASAGGGAGLRSTQGAVGESSSPLSARHVRSLGTVGTTRSHVGFRVCFAPVSDR